MTRKRYDELSPSGRRRTVTLALLRAAVSAALLVVVYYLAPLDGPLDIGAGIGLVLGLVVLAVVIIWQVRAILASDVPRLRAIQSVAIAVPTFVVLFAATYAVMSSNDPDGFSEVLGRTDALYFTVTVFATVGFGDIAPRSDVARIATMIQMVLGLVVVGLIAKIVLGAVQVAVQRRERDGPQAAETRDRAGGA
ncbi:MAG: potassium channel family protein [Pseudonocardia sp.]|nr:potassium channel family protein [Pseudonocardia sp.]